jgi:hypothetical protein
MVNRRRILCLPAIIGPDRAENTNDKSKLLDKASADQLVLQQSNGVVISSDFPAIFFTKTLITRAVHHLGGAFDETTGMAAKIRRLRSRFVLVAGDEAFLFASDDDGTGEDLPFAIEPLRSPAAKFLAPSSGQLPGVRSQAAHHGA